MNVERIREALLGQPSEEYFRQRAFAGWKPVAVIWERAIEGEPEERSREDVPYGLEVAADATTLRENAAEKQVILRVMDGVVQDKRISQIATSLNENGHRTRVGALWTPRDVFELLPRLVEIGPRVFPTHEWAQRRQQLFSAM